MAIRHGVVASSVVLPPTVSLSAATNFNQDIATLNATVSANYHSTTVKFQYSTSSTFSTFTEVNAATTPITGQSVSSYANITGLSNDTTYYFRCVATNSGGTTTSSSLSFKTWRLIEWVRSVSDVYYLTIPTVTPTGGTQVIPSIYNVFILGGGGGGGGAGGGGGGYRLVSSRAFTSTANLQLTLVVGVAGVGESSGVTKNAGGTTSITASNFTTISAGGGGVGEGGYVGTGDNPAYQSGTGASFTNGGKNDPIWFGAAGGAGTNGGGASGTAGNGYGNGGNGGPGRTEYGYSGGAGGAGWGTTSGTVSNGTNHGYGSGGHCTDLVYGTAGTAGLIRLQYYGA